MCALYESIKGLCDDRGIKPGKMCADTGISRGLISDIKYKRTKSITSETAQKIADYFGVSVDRVLGTEPKDKPIPVNEDELSELQKEALDLIRKMDEETISRFIPSAKIMLGLK